ncbi:MAG: c-type cytochrome biogenesis protein CcsB [Acidithiobacillus sp.]|nr:c-type cytochrome biogenesis protein CcsB [Acidithiobacillus sp.]
MSVDVSELRQWFAFPQGAREQRLWQRLWAVALTAGAFAVWAVFRADFWMWQYITLGIWYTGLLWFGWHWPAFRRLFFAILVVAAPGVGLYMAGYTAADSLLLRYVFQSTAMFYWMSGAILVSAVSYYWYLYAGSQSAGDRGHRFAWLATVLGFAGLAIRWKETYVGHPSWGHIPVTNMYDAMVLLCTVTALFYLYYEAQGKRRGLGAFAMPMILAADIFLIWVGIAYHQNQIQPIVPALNSFWIKLHVPCEFVAYANFYLAAMVGLAYLLRQRAERLGSPLVERLPDLNKLERIMAAMVTFGFLFFTAGTILGAVWAAKAWGGFWSWDPKETWALIVWLNYAAYLHLRGRSPQHRPTGKTLAWWSVISLLTVTFCFIGVDLFLGGLHSYAKL